MKYFQHVHYVHDNKHLASETVRNLGAEVEESPLMGRAHTRHRRHQAVQDLRLTPRALYVVHHLELSLLLRRPEMPKQELTWKQTPGEEQEEVRVFMTHSHTFISRDADMHFYYGATEQSHRTHTLSLKTEMRL